MKKILMMEKKIKHREIGIIGLGKMGGGVARQLHTKGWRVIVYNRTPEKTDICASEGLTPAYSLGEFAGKFEKSPRIIWVMLPAGTVFDDVFFDKNGLVNNLSPGDIIIDAGNTWYKDDIKRSLEFEKRGIKFVDVGISGGPSGARHGACLMVGGKQAEYEYLEPLYKDLSIENGYAFFQGIGGGHFVKMVHNGIEYGMMQSIAEGFSIMKNASFSLDLSEVARIYNTGSVIESRLVGWLEKAYQDFGVGLVDVSGEIGSNGEGEWTVREAQELGLEVPVINESVEFRKSSIGNPSYTGQVVSALRSEFGGHNTLKKK